jgi:uncharacterized membrane protein YkvA (DUF1232 family)
VEVVFAVLGAMAVAWGILAITLLATRPRGTGLGDFIRLLPDTLRLFRGLIRDPAVPSGVKVRLWLLLGYLASPLDLVPDFVPVIGYADDAIIAAIALRSVIRRAGEQKVREHWPGSEDGLLALLRAAQAR